MAEEATEIKRPVVRLLGKSNSRSSSSASSSSGSDRGSGSGFGRRRMCRFCADSEEVLDYKDPQTLKFFITERGKVLPRRISGNCAKHQRALALAVRRARMIALVPFTVTGK